MGAKHSRNLPQNAYHSNNDLIRIPPNEMPHLFINHPFSNQFNSNGGIRSVNEGNNKRPPAVVRSISNGIPPKPLRHHQIAELGGAENSNKSNIKSNSYRAPHQTSMGQPASSNRSSPIYRRNINLNNQNSNLLEDLLECPICYNQFENPHVLPCQHTFCKKCLNPLFNATTKSLDCPLCRKKHTLLQGLESLSTNLTINRLIELEVAEKNKAAAAAEKERQEKQRLNKAKCFTCQKVTYLKVCHDCSYMLCYECVANPDHDYIIGKKKIISIVIVAKF
jgi:hypothetical protein